MKRLLLQPFVLSLFLVPSIMIAQQVQTDVQPVSLEKALKLAPEQSKKILVDVFASWCPYCQRMHSEVYTAEPVRNAISEYYLWVRINIESNEMVNYLGKEMTQSEFAQALDNKNVPTTYFLNDEGAILGVQPGYLEENVFSNLLNFVGSDAYLNQSFTEYVDED